MRASKFSIEKLLKAIAIIKTGITIKDACRQENISLTTFYSWRGTLEMAILLQKNSLFKQLSSQTTLKAKRKATKLEEEKEDMHSKRRSIQDEEKALLDLLAEIVVDMVVSRKQHINSKERNYGKQV